MSFEAMITRLNKAYIVLKKHGQEYTDKSKVEQLANRIRNPGNNIQITVAIETMREAHKANYTSAVQYITSRMAQINSASINAPGPNPRRINEGNSDNRNNPPRRTEFNGVNIRNPFRTFSDIELTRLGERGQAVVEELKRNWNNSGRGNSGRGRGHGRGRGGYGRGGRGYRYHRDRPNVPNEQGANANNGGGNRNVSEVSAEGRAGSQQPGPTSSNSVSSVSQSQASSNNERGAQNGTRFGNNRA
jgi:hypothetical protein